MALAQKQIETKKPGEVRGDPLKGRRDALFAANDDSFGVFEKDKAAANDADYLPDTIDKQYRKEAYQISLGKIERTKRFNQQQEEGEDTEYYNQPYLPNQTILKKLAALRGPNKAKLDLAEQARASSVVTGIMIGQIPWIIIQVKFALLGSLFFAAVGAMDSVTDTEGKGFFGTIIAGVASAINNFAKVIGIDFGEIAFFGYLFCFIIIMGIFFFSFLTATITMMVNNLRPLSGRGENLKYGTLLLVFIGYSLPLINAFPWILLYLFVVRLYPK